MSFLRHPEIYPPMRARPHSTAPPTHRLDEFPAGYSLAGCAPAVPASASPARAYSEVQLFCRSRTFHRTATSVLTGCLTPGDKRNGGRLDFSFTFTDDNTTDVLINMKYSNGLIYLDSFKAVSVGRSLVSASPSALEFKIPDYSYRMQVPVLMKGWKSEEDKVRDDMEKSLSTEDRNIWLSIRDNLGSIKSDQALRKAIPDYDEVNSGKKEFTQEHARAMQTVILEEVSKLLEGSTMSADGKQKTMKFMTDSVASIK